MLVRDTLKATQRSPTMPFTVFRFGNFGLAGPPIWRLASANCCWLGSESSPLPMPPGAQHPANPFPDRRAPPPESRQLGLIEFWEKREP